MYVCSNLILSISCKWIWLHCRRLWKIGCASWTEVHQTVLERSLWTVRVWGNCCSFQNTCSYSFLYSCAVCIWVQVLLTNSIFWGACLYLVFLLAKGHKRQSNLSPHLVFFIFTLSYKLDVWSVCCFGRSFEYLTVHSLMLIIFSSIFFLLYQNTKNFVRIYYLEQLLWLNMHHCY